MAEKLYPTERAILDFLDETGGYLTAKIVKAVRPDMDNGHMRSAWIRGALDRLERRGLVRKLDDQKPACWCRTAAGTAALAELRAP